MYIYTYSNTCIYTHIVIHVYIRGGKKVRTFDTFEGFRDFEVLFLPSNLRDTPTLIVTHEQYNFHTVN